MIPLFFLHYRISTHTLTWSVTKQAMSGVMLYYISTHTLTWSVTLQPWWLPPMCQNFNSHAHVERDGNTLDVLCDTANFNSHAHVERDMQRRYGENCRGKFQLTRSRGA